MSAGFLISQNSINGNPLMFFTQHFKRFIFKCSFTLFPHPQWSALCTLFILYFRKTLISTSCFLRDQVQSERGHCYQLKFTQKYQHFNWYFCCISYFGTESCSDKNSKMSKVYLDNLKRKIFWLYICTISVTQTNRDKV